MKKRAMLAAASCAAILLSPITVLGGASASAKSSGKAATTCPKQAKAALPLPPDAVAKAAEAAFRQAPRRFKGIDTLGERILSSSLARTEAFLVRQCGRRIANRTVVVSLRFPKMLPSAILSEGTVFVSRFEHGYRIWEISPINA